MLAFLLALLLFAALLPVLSPLLRKAGPRIDESAIDESAIDGAAFDRAVYRDQLREIERDIERGVLTETEAVSVRLEIQRRLLAADTAAGPVRMGSSRIAAAAAGLCTAGGAVGLYLVLGMPVAPSLTNPVAREVNSLAEALRANPGDAGIWARYAHAVSRLDRWADAETAWRRVIALGQATPETLASLGEVLVLRDQGRVGPEALGLFDLARNGAPGNEVARYYQAMARAQAGDAKGALAEWQALKEDLPPNAPGRLEIEQRIEQTARAAGLPPPTDADRMVMIEGMVARLAARLEREPGDADGWAQLGRSYAVLGKNEAAADAYEKAAALRPSDPAPVLAAAEALLAGLKPQDAMPPRAVALLRRAEPLAGQDPAVLWYLGLAAARDRQIDVARDYWTRLTKVLPPEGDDAKMARAALEALAGRH